MSEYSSRLGLWFCFLARWMAAFLWMPADTCFGGFYDSTVGDQKKTYEYLEKVESQIGSERFEEIPFDYALSLAGSYGLIDRADVAPQTFFTHIERVRDLERRFYRGQPLTADEVKAWLLPQRLRYEIRTKGDWLPALETRFKPVVAGAKTSDEAAGLVLGWLSGHIKLARPAESYPIPTRGDLDPMTVLNGCLGTEVDVAICGVAALRSAGVASRLVWAPALRLGAGGKMWLEYLGEEHTWVPWVPSYGKEANHAEKLSREFGRKIVFVMARPEAPVEVTDRYVDPVEVTFNPVQEGVEISLMVVGESGLLTARGIEVESMRREGSARLGPGSLVIAASFNGQSFALLPLEIAADSRGIVITAEGGRLRADERMKDSE